MNTKKVIVAALAAFILFSCTREVEVLKEVPAEQGVTRFKLTVDNGFVQSKATNDHTGKSLTDGEDLIYNYAVLIFNSQGILEGSLLADPYTQNAQNPETYTGELEFDPSYGNNSDIMDAQGVITMSAGTKYFYTLVNAPADLLNRQGLLTNNTSLIQSAIKEETLTLYDLSTIVGSYDNNNVIFDNQNPENRGFMMTTPTKVVGSYSAVLNNGLQSQHLPSTEDDPATIYSVNLLVGRAMAKVSLADDLEEGNRAQQFVGDLAIEGYRVINNPTEMNVVADINAGILRTPYYADADVDPDKYFASSGANEYIAPTTNTAPTYTYCIENSNRVPKQGNSTCVVVKGVFTPDPAYIYQDDGTQGGTLNNNTFWRIKDSTTGEYEQPDKYYVEEPIPSIIPAGKETVEYPNGECYYHVWLKDESSESPYAVRRNTFYQIDVIEVAGAGEPNPEVPGPEKPLEEQTTFKVKITVTDWETISQDGKL